MFTTRWTRWLPLFGSITRSFSRQTAFAALIVCSLLWGTGVVVTKQTLEYFPPLLLLIVQLAASCAVLWTAAIVTNTIREVNRSTISYALAGIFEPGLSSVLYMIGLAQTSASNAALITSAEPLLAIALAWLLLREKLSRKVFTVLALGLVGTIILSVASPEGGSTSNTFSGDSLIFGSALAAALYVIVARSSLSRLSAIPLAALQQTCGLLVALACLPLAAQQGEFALLTAVSADTWAVAIVTGITQYGLAFILYLGALRYVSATRATLTLMLIPVFGVLGAVLFLGEQMSSAQMIGAALLLPSVFGTKRMGR